jgi:hypothetical protein
MLHRLLDVRVPTTYTTRLQFTVSGATHWTTPLVFTLRLTLPGARNLRFNFFRNQMATRTVSLNLLLLCLKLNGILRTTVSRPVSCDRSPSGTHDQFSFLLHGNYLKTFAAFYYGAPSLTRGRVCNFQCSQGLMGFTTTSYSLIWDSSPCINIPQG